MDRTCRCFTTHELKWVLLCRVPRPLNVALKMGFEILGISQFCRKLGDHLEVKINGVFFFSQKHLGAPWMLENQALVGKSLAKNNPTAVVPHERVQQRTVDAPLPQILKETVEVVGLVPQERVQQRIDKQIVEFPVPHRVKRIDKQFVQVLLPHITKDSVEEFKIAPQEQFSERIFEQIVHFSVPPS